MPKLKPFRPETQISRIVQSVQTMKAKSKSEPKQKLKVTKDGKIFFHGNK